MEYREFEVFVYLTLFIFVNNYAKKYKKNTKVPEEDCKPAPQGCGKDVENCARWLHGHSGNSVLIIDYKGDIISLAKGGSPVFQNMLRRPTADAVGKSVKKDRLEIKMSCFLCQQID